jgi:hypothetical protein
MESPGVKRKKDKTGTQKQGKRERLFRRGSYNIHKKLEKSSEN